MILYLQIPMFHAGVAVLFFINQSSCISFPVILKSTDVLELNANDTLQLTCKGEMPINWHMKRTLTVESEEHGLIRFSTEQRERYWKSEGWFYGKLSLIAVQYYDTGKYYCRYTSVSQDIENLYRTSVYVYVNDGIHLFLDHQIVPGSFRTYHASADDSFQVPCQATSPKIRVSLWEETSRRQVSSSDHAIIYDPEEGLEVENLTGQHGDFSCRGVLGNITDKYSFWLYNLNAEKEVEDRFIEIQDYRAVIELSPDATMQLTCVSNFPNEWEVKTATSEKRKEIFPRPKNIRAWSKNGFKYVSLTVSGGNYEDTGTYTCKFQDSEYLPYNGYNASVYVYVYDPSHLFVSSDIDSEEERIYFSYPDEELIIPCRTTSPSLNVTFWNETSDQDITPSILNISYNPQKGFSMRFQNNLEGLFSCRTRHEQALIEKFIFKIIIVDDTTLSLSVSTVLGMKDCNNGIVEVSSKTYRLDVDLGSKIKFCVEIHRTKSSYDTMVIWTRNDNTFENTEQRIVSVETSSTVLTIQEVQEEDLGYYKLSVWVAASTDSLALIVDVPETVASNDLFIILGVVISSVFVGILGFVCFYANRKRKLAILNTEVWMKQSQETNIPLDYRWEFPKQRLLLGPTIGHGAFGKVVRAEATGIVEGENVTTVAIKMLKIGAGFAHRRALLEELKILILLGKHLNIVNLLGAVTKFISTGELLVIVEFCGQGNIRDLIIRKKKRFCNQVNGSGILDTTIQTPTENQYVLTDTSTTAQSISQSSGIFTGPINHLEGSSTTRSILSSDQAQTSISSEATEKKEAEDNSDDGDILTTSDLLNYAFQCSRGMEYLASRKLVHRDLAARNVLVNSENIVKICDFGLSRDEDYLYCRKGRRSNTALPVRWMSPESIGRNAFTSKSDVWSFGIFLWEMFSLGLVPYPGLDMNDNFYQRLQNGYRMDKPRFAPDSIYEIMKKCWNLLPEDRPSFEQLAESLGFLIENELRLYYLILNEPYEKENEQNPYYEELGEIIASSMLNDDELADLEGIPSRTTNGEDMEGSDSEGETSQP